jgi:hypothetical protein
VHDSPATCVAGGVASAWQPQRQLAPGQSAHWQYRVERTVMKIS